MPCVGPALFAAGVFFQPCRLLRLIIGLFQYRNIQLLHLKHGLCAPLDFCRIFISEHLAQRSRCDLPGYADLTDFIIVHKGCLLQERTDVSICWIVEDDPPVNVLCNHGRKNIVK